MGASPVIGARIPPSGAGYEAPVGTTTNRFDERFVGAPLDRETWLDSYLPQWSSRAGAAATWCVADDGLHLTIPIDKERWCPEQHPEPLRVSCIQSGCFAGPLGSTVGQQPFRDGIVVREEQPTMRGYTPHFGRVDVRMRMDLSPRSMAAFWLAGFEDRPERSGEICVAEVFGDALHPRGAAVGMGIHAFRDPELVEEWATEPMAIDVAAPHTYGVAWRPGSTEIAVDGVVVRQLAQAPDYPMQLMIGVFDFPAKAVPGEEVAVPELVVERVTGWPPAT